MDLIPCVVPPKKGKMTLHFPKSNWTNSEDQVPLIQPANVRSVS
jgi:hypothetical protein